MKIALLGTGFGQAHAAVYAQRPDVDEVVVFGRAPAKLAAISEQFGFRLQLPDLHGSQSREGDGHGGRATARRLRAVRVAAGS
jgi:predicted dehydrogenase